MPVFLLQLQLLLAALGAVLPLAPASKRDELGRILETIAAAVRFGEAAAGGLDELTAKLAAVRGEIETMAAAGREASAADLEAAFDRVRAASAAFRAAITDSAPS